ncbi:MAG TPA: Asp-tRNA(Asn)/Glu-tRNA(Gln) amidotransferase subunit GatA [Candidatus Peribacteraceae bacterium]|nr:Asp-tRNA(Asn)/Glu-tRNA(Gln) amidotransferase subunit GatA [Candidatus Peribacteraceae bacterium]
MLSALTITEAHGKLQKKEISCVELVQSCIDRIEKIDQSLNAVIFRNFERALLQAKKVDEQGVSDHPLSGIPYLAKDVYCEEGVQTTGCSNVLRNKNYVPPFDSTTTKRLKNAGAISIGKTNTDEFTMGGSTETSCYGVTRNPWDTTRVAGGSSGGSAAGVAADECLFALGTDTGGSIRQPASFCNVTGLRTTYGRTSRYGVMSMASSLDTIGPITKNVEDLAIILQAIAGKDPLDGTTDDVPVPDYRAALKKDMKGLKIGIPREYFIEGVNPEVEAAVREAANVLRNLGATIAEISLPYTKYGVATYYVLSPSEVSSNMARYDGIRFGHSVNDPKDLLEYYFRVRSEGFGAEVKRRIMIGTYALSAGYYDAYYRQAQKVRTLIKQDFADAFQTVDVVLSPVAPNPPWIVGAYSGDPVSMYLEDAFTIPQAMAGIPAISVPCGFAKPQESLPELPIGLQIMGPQWGEEAVLRAGYAYEQATEWHTQKPKL